MSYPPRHLTSFGWVMSITSGTEPTTTQVKTSTEPITTQWSSEDKHWADYNTQWSSEDKHWADYNIQWSGDDNHWANYDARWSSGHRRRADHSRWTMNYEHWTMNHERRSQQESEVGFTRAGGVCYPSSLQYTNTSFSCYPSLFLIQNITIFPCLHPELSHGTQSTSYNLLHHRRTFQRFSQFSEPIRTQ